jgi:excisionase family DNA binding protein
LRNPEETVMKWGWVLITLYMGPVALALYVIADKEAVMASQKTSLQQLRQALDELRQAVEEVESALIEFEEQARGEEGEQGAQRLQSGTSFQLLSVPQVCQELGMGKSWVYRRIKSGEIPSVKLGHSIKVRREDLEQYLDSQRYQADADAE